MGKNVTDEIAKDFKKLARETELRFARSVLRWKSRKEGREFPSEKELDLHAERVAEAAQRAMVEGAKRLWRELRGAHGNQSPPREGKDD